MAARFTSLRLPSLLGRAPRTPTLLFQQPSGSALRTPTTATQRSMSTITRAPRPTIHTAALRSKPFAQGSSRRTFRSSARSRSSKSEPHAEDDKLSFGARMKKLTREYGWVTVGVYLALSVADFPFCFLLVKVAGPEKIGELEHYVVSHVGQVIPESVKTMYGQARDVVKSLFTSKKEDEAEAQDWGVKKAQEANQTEASLVTQLALAYAIHKSFIFVRVPLTAAVTPKVVKVLRRWGWQIGKKKTKP